MKSLSVASRTTALLTTRGLLINTLMTTPTTSLITNNNNNNNNIRHYSDQQQHTSASHTQHITPASAVNIDDWSLNPEIVQRDLETQERWASIGTELTASKLAKDHSSIITIATRGLAYFTEVGVEHAPLQCEPMLHMELSQAYYNMCKYSEALSSAIMAKTSIGSGNDSSKRDMAKLGEVNEFIGFIHLKMGNIDVAEETFRELMQWIDVGSKTAMPMVTVAAMAMRRTVVMGQGLVLVAKADNIIANKSGGGDAPGIYSMALDKLVMSLDDHIQEGDVIAVKDTLLGCLRCFVGLGDVAQAKETCMKVISWCRRHGDSEGVSVGEGYLKNLE